MIYLFNSFDFLLFFAVIAVMYWIVPSKFRNVLLLIASYAFYASWNWKLLSLLLLSSAINFSAGLKIYKGHSKKAYLSGTVVVNLAILGFFKYYGFFAENLIALLNGVGLNFNYTTLAILLPIGISFYTFQAMSYVIDIYRGKIAPTKNFVNFSLFVAYFPQLIAGPIERAKDLLPRIRAPKKLKNVNYKEGFYLFVYGLFKKVIIADSVAVIVDKIYAIPNPTGAEVLIATYAFAIQIYADFSGYSSMARGISRFFGIELSTNFNLPYLAANAADFWKRWHITLSNWVRDYIYIPLGGRKSWFYGSYALIIAWLLMGLWHGAAWHFVLWGFYWAIIILIYRMLRKLARNWKLKAITKVLLIATTFHITVYGWLLFRAQSFGQIVTFTQAVMTGINISELVSTNFWAVYVAGLFLIIYEVILYLKNDQLFIYKKNFYLQLIFYMILFLVFLQLGVTTNVQFLYFQF